MNRNRIGCQVRALSLPGGHHPIPEGGDQQPRDAAREVERALEVVALGECPNPETGEGHGEDELPDAHLARSHNGRMVLLICGARQRPPSATALRGGCRTNPRRPRWSLYECWPSSSPLPTPSARRPRRGHFAAPVETQPVIALTVHAFEKPCKGPTFGFISSGGGGIRTHERLATPTVFETAPFNHSGTPPGTAGRF